MKKHLLARNPEARFPLANAGLGDSELFGCLGLSLAGAMPYAANDVTKVDSLSKCEAFHIENNITKR